MPSRLNIGCTLAAALLSLMLSGSASAVILYSTDVRNTEPPGSLSNRDTNLGPQGSDDPRRLLNSGWQYEGQFQGFLGTPIGSQYFVTARHIQGDVGSTIDYNGVTYTTTAYWDHHADPNDPNSQLLSDLRIWKISGTFTTWAPLYNASVDGTEVGKSILITGRGTQRGAPVTLNGTLKGWQWGTQDGVQSWGENVVTGTTDYTLSSDNKLMYFDFDADGGPNEAALTLGDSGGGIFINAGGTWKLAGINFAVDGPWRYTVNGTDFNASLFDAGGLYAQYGSAGNWQLVPDGAIGSSYASRISAELSWIQSITGISAGVAVPEPTSTGLVMLSLAVLLKRRRLRSA
jgi:hypothetical protein